MRPGIALIFFLISVLCLSACEDTVIDPFNNDEKYFTIYGSLDLLERSHEVRVIPVTRRAQKVTNDKDPASQLDAMVRTINLLNDDTVRWHHSLEELEDNTFGHVFRANFIISAGGIYRIEVVRSDGAITHAETRVPVIHTAQLFESEPVLFSNDSTTLTQDIHIPQINSPWDIQAVYLWASGPINRRVFVPYGRRGKRGENGGWDMTLEISEDQKYVRENIEQSRTQEFENFNLPVTLSAMGVQVRILDENWDPPNGVFDPETLESPDVLTNVVNGYGFWGSIGLYREEWNACVFSGVLGYTPAEFGC